MSKDQPDISVLMPVYNNAKFLREAIRSILDQSFTNFEFLIINDGSTDDSENIIRSFSDNRIVYVKNEKNAGLIATLNKGLKLCRAPLIARMDADDIALPQRFKKQVEFLNLHPEVTVLGTKLIMIDANGKETGYWNDDFETTARAAIAATMPKLNCLGHPTVMMRKEIVERFGYSRRLKASEDWGLWLTLLSEGYVIDKLDETLLKYRVHDEGTTVSANRKNVSKKIIAFKAKYLWGKVATFRFMKSDKFVFRYLLIDTLKYYFSFLYKFLIKVAETKISVLLRQRRAFKRVFSDFPEDTKAIFFFPFYHLGGAEVVHADIVRAAAFTKPLVVFTNYSGSDTLLPSFEKYASVLCIDQLVIWPYMKRKVIAKITEVCNQHKSMVLFSSNSKFFYEFVREIPSHTKAIDLIHAFMHKHEDSAEKWSLPVVNKLSERVVINLKTKKDYEEQYLENQVPAGLLERIVYISNFVNKVEMPHKTYEGVLKVLYVGRGTSEKRVHLLAKIAKQFHQEGLPLEFHFVGDVIGAIPQDCRHACTIHGEIRDKSILNRIYSESHFLAMSSTREGFPMVIMEAMMHATVPITTNVGGIYQHVIHDQTGILINEIEPDQFCEAFEKEIKALLNNRTKLEELGKNAYHYAAEHFTEEKFMESYTRLFSQNNGL